MKKNNQILLLLFIQFYLFGHCYSQNQDNIYKLNIIVKNLNQESLDSARVTVIQLKSDIKQTVSYSNDCRCYLATNLELGKVIIRVENQGYDTLEVYHSLNGPTSSAFIALGKTNSKYFLLNSNKFPFETNGETVAICTRSMVKPKEFFKGRLKGDDVLVLKSGWYKLEAFSSSTGRNVYLITPKQNQQQGPLLADLRKLYPDIPIGILTSLNNDANILLNSCDIEFKSGINENNIGKVLKKAGAKSWKSIKHSSSYKVTFSENTGLELLKIAEDLKNRKEINSISNSIFSTYVPGWD